MIRVLAVLKKIYWGLTVVILAYTPLYYIFDVPLDIFHWPWIYTTFGWVYLTGLLLVIKSVFMLKGRKKIGFAVLATGVAILVFGYYIALGIVYFVVIGMG